MAEAEASYPLLRYSGGGLGWGPFAHDRRSTQPPPQPSPGVPREGEKRPTIVSRTADYRRKTT